MSEEWICPRCNRLNLWKSPLPYQSQVCQYCKTPHIDYEYEISEWNKTIADCEDYINFKREKLARIQYEISSLVSEAGACETDIDRSIREKEEAEKEVSIIKGILRKEQLNFIPVFNRNYRRDQEQQSLEAFI